MWLNLLNVPKLKSLSIEQIINGILNRDQQVLKEIYNLYFPYVKRFILDNNGDPQNAKDVFQEAIILIYRKIKNGNFEINSSFKTYIYSVSRFIWLKQLEKERNDKQNKENYVAYEQIEDFVDEYKKNKEYRLYQHHFKRLGEDCQKLLRMFYQKVPLSVIAKELGYDGSMYIKRKKFKCKEQLVRYIKNDPEFEKEDEDEDLFD